MDIVLTAGLWLDSSVWAGVAQRLQALGHRALPVSLPGQGAPPDNATLDDQIAAVLAAVDSADGRPLVVGHSAACTLAWLAADARPDKVAGAALIGGFPSNHGEVYADFFDVVDGVMAFPGWEPFEGPDSDDLDEKQRAEIAAGAIPVPEGVAKATVVYHDERRYDVPVTLICPEFSPEQAREWVEGGDVPQLADAKHVDYVDIESGHWPMFSEPDRLAEIIAGIADA